MRLFHVTFSSFEGTVTICCYHHHFFIFPTHHNITFEPQRNMARQFNYKLQGGREELRIQTLVFVLCVTLSLLAAIIFFCADGTKNPKRNSEDNNNGLGGSACAAGCGSACGGGCGG
ncbi:unnamed protein product [Sphenostylis stenocarpa]|uniref:Transmembrane protein n=1 Tax=Sphenostylis stenocarpa TaxID=92480 RepID=A0AA86W310_9FABA|nr:unnamed protein product [Sphenostylis stenocarpa]